MFTGGVIGVGSFLAGVPGPLNGWVKPDLGLFIAYSVSALMLVIVSRLENRKFKL